MVRHTGTRHQSIIAYCSKYRIEDTTLHDTDKRSQEQWERDTRTVNKPLIDLGPQNLLSDTLDIVLLQDVSAVWNDCRRRRFQQYIGNAIRYRCECLLIADMWWLGRRKSEVVQ